MDERWIGVDLDGTLAEYNGWEGPESIGRPIPQMLGRVHRWLSEGKTVKVFTARAAIPEQVVYVRRWLDCLGLFAVDVSASKDMHMMEMWDDRAVAVEKNTGRRLSNNSWFDHAITPYESSGERL